MPAWAIEGPRHAGITVSNLDRSLVFYEGLLGLELLWRRLYEEAEVRRIVGVPEATGLDIAMLRVPGSDFEVELLEYRGLEPASGASPPSHTGTGHFCLFVTGIDALHEERDIAEITGVPEASAFDIAMLRIPGSDVEVELIEYKGCERHSGSARPCDYGTGHFALFVEDIEGLYSDLAARGVAFRSDGPVEKRTGGKSLYSLDPDGYVIEFSERAK
jgi:catechol 2,3-dioxygenase-like lactoylglutathione lyase family enzyme